MGFAITGVGIVNALGRSAHEVAAGLRRGTTQPIGDDHPDAAALLRQVTARVARARQRWGPRRVAIVLGQPRDPTPLLELATTLTEARGPAYAVTTGPLASAHAVVSAQHLLDADLADAVLVASTSDLGGACMLLERQATADFELVRAAETLDLAADWIISEDPVRTIAPIVALAPYVGDLGPSHGLTAAIAAVLALHDGFIPGSPAREAECDRVACTSSHGSLRVTLTIGARSS